jgi:hypothetical protein
LNTGTITESRISCSERGSITMSAGMRRDAIPSNPFPLRWSQTLASSLRYWRLQDRVAQVFIATDIADALRDIRLVD